MLSEVIGRNLLFVSGKGGVGKTAVSQAIALLLSQQGKRTLWATFEDPLQPAGELKQKGPKLWHLNCDATLAFEEYAAMKIGAARLTRLFLQNKLMRYLAQAAPGIHELVLLGKIWHERNLYDHVIVDMPSTGYGLAMFQSTVNFARLFRGGPVHRDAEAMLATFRDPRVCGQLIVALPEEMPLRESIELGEFLTGLFPKNPPAYLVNRVFPGADTGAAQQNPDRWTTPLASSPQEYCLRRAALETFNLRLWKDASISYDLLRYIPPPEENALPQIVSGLAEQLSHGVKTARA
jgi:hypothetical protein